MPKSQKNFWIDKRTQGWTDPFLQDPPTRAWAPKLI